MTKNWILDYLRTLRRAWQLFVMRPTLNLGETDYDRYWQDKRHDQMGAITDFQQHRADLILPYLRDGESVLDIGSGDGGVLLYLCRQRKLIAYASDFSQYALDFLAGRGVNTIKLDAASAGGATLPTVDHVLILEVLEHVQNPEKFLRQMTGRARRSVVFSIPNSGYFPYRLRLLLGSFPVQWRLHPGEHLRFWTVRDLKWWLGQLGLADRATIHCYEGLPGLNRLWPAMFSMGMVCHIRCDAPSGGATPAPQP